MAGIARELAIAFWFWQAITAESGGLLVVEGAEVEEAEVEGADDESLSLSSLEAELLVVSAALVGAALVDAVDVVGHGGGL